MIIISGARLIDGTGAGPTEGVDVLVLDGAIADVSPSGTTAPPDGAQRIDASGMTLMPGLIDCHDHLSSFGYGLADKWGLTESSSLRHMRVASVLEKTLATGYTTIRDAGGLEAGFRDAVDEGLVRGPNLQVVLDVITPTEGSEITPVRRGTTTLLRPTRRCPTALPMDPTRCANGSGRWFWLAPTRSRPARPAARARDLDWARRT